MMSVDQSTETSTQNAPGETGKSYSALEEFRRDERRPALWLLCTLVVSAIFFALGIMVGRWSTTNTSQPGARPGTTSTVNAKPASEPTTAPPSTAATVPSSAPPTSTSEAQAQSSPDLSRRFSLLIATYNSQDKAQALVKRLEEQGYAEIRTTEPRAGDSRKAFSVLVGHYTRDEATAAAARLRMDDDPRLKNVRVIESAGQ